jgi:hypothetical protein
MACLFDLRDSGHGSLKIRLPVAEQVLQEMLELQRSCKTEAGKKARPCLSDVSLPNEADMMTWQLRVRCVRAPLGPLASPACRPHGCLNPLAQQL